MTWTRIFGRRRMMEDLDQEIRDFIERETQDNIERGLPPDKARYAALRKFGNVTRIKEEAREVWSFVLLEQLWGDLRLGLRMLAKNPGFTAVAVLTLAIGIGANAAIFSLIDAIVLRVLPVAKPDELVELRIRDPHRAGGAYPAFTNPIWEQVRDRQDVFSGVFAWDTDRFDLAQGGTVHYANGIWVSGDFFKTLGLRPAAGRLITASDDQRGCAGAAVLSYGFWQENYGGAQGVIGGTLSLSAHPFEVVAIAPPSFNGMDVGARFDVAIPICAAALFDGTESRLDMRNDPWLTVVGRIKPGLSPSKLAARLAVLSPQVFSATAPLSWSPAGQKRFEKWELITTSAATGISSLRRQFGRPLKTLMAVVGLVLLIACANIASLMLARGAARRKEIALRQALGASRCRLVRQLLTECVLLSSAGALLGILFARWGTAVLVRYISTAKNAVYLDLALDRRVLSFTAATAVFTGVLFGLLPALRSTRVSLTSAMKGSHAIETERPVPFRSRHWIVASQVALSLVLLVAAGLFLRSFTKLSTLDLGFDRDNVLLVSTNLYIAKVPPDVQLSTDETIESRLRVLPGVVSVGRSVGTPISDFRWNSPISTEWPQSVTGGNALAYFNFISPGFFLTLRMPLLRGRNFNGGDTKQSPAVAVVNTAFEHRFFPGIDALGKTFRIRDPARKPGAPIEVVGIVKDAKYQLLREEPPPTTFFPVTQVSVHHVRDTFELRTGMRPSALVSPVLAAVGGVNKQLPLEFHTLAEQVDDSMVQERLLALLSGFFGALALLLAMIGLYGTLSYLVAQRQREFGIRLALGAQHSAIVRLVMGDLIAVLAGGVVLGVGISLATTRLLQQLLFGLGPRDPVTILGAVTVLSVVALIAGYRPARRATKADPMVALRYE